MEDMEVRDSQASDGVTRFRECRWHHHRFPQRKCERLHVPTLHHAQGDEKVALGVGISLRWLA